LKLIDYNIWIFIFDNNEFLDMNIDYDLIEKNILFNELIVIHLNWDFFYWNKIPGFKSFINLSINLMIIKENSIFSNNGISFGIPSSWIHYFIFIQWITIQDIMIHLWRNILKILINIWENDINWWKW